jgi:hypothetical protein
MSSDPSGASGVPTGIGLQMWAKPLQPSGVAVLVLNNRNPMASNVSATIAMKDVLDIIIITAAGRSMQYNATDIWTAESLLSGGGGSGGGGGGGSGGGSGGRAGAGAGWLESTDGSSPTFQTDSFGGHDSRFYLFEPVIIHRE